MQDTFGRFSSNLYKGDNFGTPIYFPSKSGSIRKGKILLPFVVLTKRNLL